MKKVLKTIAAVLAFIAVTSNANAQLYLTGSFGMSNTTNGDDSSEPTHNVFHIGAEVGYYFTDNMAFGGEVRFYHDKYIDANDKKYWDADNSFQFNPYFRFDFVANDKINFGVKTKAVLGFGKTKNQDKDKSKYTDIRFGFFPVLNYKFNSHWSAGVEFGSLYYQHYVTKNPNNDNKDKTNKWSANLSWESLGFSVVYTF
ncbi:MAG: porin family protein [Bacteroidales bacterium]|nr:porin family protein [Bacteroidales bacterium]